MTRIIAFSGSYSRHSRTWGLLDAIAQKVRARYGIEVIHYDMQALGPSLGRAHDQDGLDRTALKIIDEIKQATALIVGVPVYKGSYPGLFKHFIDLIEPEQLAGKPIVLAASGGGERHALVVEHQLRPLFGFFMAHTLPTALYAAARDYGADNRIVAPDLIARIETAVNQLDVFLHAHARAAGSNATRAGRGAADYKISHITQRRGERDGERSRSA